MGPDVDQRLLEDIGGAYHSSQDALWNSDGGDEQGPRQHQGPRSFQTGSRSGGSIEGL